MYSDENIFKWSTETAESAEISRSKASSGSIAALKYEFELEKERYSQLSAQKQQLASLLKEMQGALFELRVSGQAIDSLNLQPLADTVARICQQVQQLSTMCTRADSAYMISFI